ncbi:MAG: hypothetical protein K6A36_01255 [Paludibacteraceae bacterium]|nr:hypothetical protein [Paludibacteraceae bacterium]
MKKIIVLILVFFPIDIFGQGIECFTHPLCGFPITLFSAPSAFSCLKDLSVSGEAGYEVEALRTENGYILISHPNDENEQVWVRIGDVGVVIQNYNNYSIPVYTQPDSFSVVQTYLSKSYIAILYEWNKDFVKVCVKDEKAEYIGWVDRRYICGSPYTTCN